MFLIVALLLGVSFAYFFLKFKSPSPPSANVKSSDLEKENSARIMNEQLKNVPPLTEKQKEDIAKEMTQSL